MTMRPQAPAAQPVPETLAYAAGVMATFGPPWSLCGGWAVDAWLGRQSRNHLDVDIAVFEEDQAAIFDHLSDWQLIGHEDIVAPDTTQPWDGRRLELPAHIHARSGGFELEVVLNERSGRDWVLSREPPIGRPLGECVHPCPWGLPTVVPEVLLFYKAKDLRPHDELDFRALLPHLSRKQSAWLVEAISRVQPGHPWLTDSEADRSRDAEPRG